jgi:glucose/arabinose dehydrogenase
MSIKKYFVILAILPLIMGSIYCNDNDNGDSANLVQYNSDIRLPKGFQIEVFADNVKGARSMVLSPEGVLFVGTRGTGNVYAVLDKDGDYKADEVIKIASGLDSPNGVAFANGSLYVAENSRVIRFDNIETNLNENAPFSVVNDGFPTDKSHGWKFISFGPDGKLYVPVGAPCNICLREDERYASLMRMDPDGSNLEVFAHGIRNTVGFDWHPETNELWFTDNGRDQMGDDVPPDELNRAPEKDMHFGYPFFHGGDIADPEYGSGKNPDDYVKPVQNLGPHVAALGMRFYTGNMFPAEYKNQIFIAEHGSWNRSQKIGYRVMLVKLNGNQAVSYQPFAEGWLKGDNVSGRPVDVQVMPDGSLLLSDDYGGVIYRITYKG